MKLTPKQKKLAAMYGNPKKITRGDVIAAAIAKKAKKKSKKKPKRTMPLKYDKKGKRGDR